MPPHEGCRLPLNIGFLPSPVDPSQMAMARSLRSTVITPLHRCPGGRVTPRFWHRPIRFRHFIDGLLALASLNLACRNLVPAFPQRSPAIAFDDSSLRWLGISDLIAEPEGPTFISYKVARSRLDRLRFVTQDPERTLRRPHFVQWRCWKYLS